jgi:hypothetical protein
MKRILICWATMAMAACSTTEATPSGPGGGGAGNAGGSGDAGGAGGAGGAGPSVGADQTVTAFDGGHVYFGAENHRTIDAAVTFPEVGPQFDRITLHFALRCPNQRCDPWDRLGWLSVVRADGDQEAEIEIARFITPYHVGGSWELDVTDLRPLLAGQITVRAFIDTWVGPGSSYGDGWLVDAAFDFHGGVPAREAIAAVPVWAPSEHVHGDPAQPIALSTSVTLPAAASSATLRSFVTGHGQGNKDNCAEFCALEHRFDIGGDTRKRTVWRDDCRETAVPDQQGTWQYPRAGWCPGALVTPWTEDIQSASAAGAQLDIGYAVEDYVNTCRPDSETCTGCTLGTGCEYDGGAHTAPNYRISSLLVLYR